MDKGIRNLYEHYMADLGPVASASIAGLKVGITTGVVTLLKTLSERREG